MIDYPHVYAVSTELRCNCGSSSSEPAMNATYARITELQDAGYIVLKRSDLAALQDATGALLQAVERIEARMDGA